MSRPATETVLVRLFQPLLLTGMLTCLAVPVVAVGEGLVRGWQGEYLLIMTPLAVLEGMAALRLQARARDYGWERAGRVLTELTGLVVATKLLSYLGRGFPALQSDARGWLAEPLSFFDGDTLPAVAAVLIVRSVGRRALSALDELAIAGPVVVDVHVATDFVRRFIVGGAFWMLGWSGFIVLLSGLQPELVRILSVRVQVAFVLYFGFSLLLLAHANYLRRRALWRVDGMEVPESVPRRWIYWGAAFTAAVFLIAALLPAGGAIASWELLGWLVTLIFLVGQVIFLFLVVLLSPAMRFLASLMSEPGEESGAEAPPIEPGPTFEELLGIDVDWLLIGRRILEALVLLTLAAALLYLFSRRRGIPLASVDAAAGWLKRTAHEARLHGRELWKRFLAWLFRARGRTRLAWNRLRASVFFGRRGADEEGDWLGLLRAGTPRARIRRYYLTLLRRAESAGLRRQPHQTPQEYAASLLQAVAQNEPEVDLLTEAFTHARYDDREVEADQVAPVRRAWQTLRRLLRPRQAESNGADGREGR